MTRKPRSTPHLFSGWDAVRRAIERRERVVMFLDFDGTLAHIAPTPDQVRLEQRTRTALSNLARHSSVSVVIISGRRRAELERYIDLPSLKYLGLYGWETNGRMALPLPVREALVATILDLVARLPKNSGVWVEPKGGSFSVHLMGATPQMRNRVESLVAKLVKPRRETLKVIANLRDLEVAPVAIGDKGAGVRSILSEPKWRGALPIYFGDDLSDEPGFEAARTGIPVLVGKRRETRAKFSVRGPAEVTEALSRMEEIVRWKERPRRLSSMPSLI
jgi:trehalose 6-phosphate phosphatase